MEQWSVTILRYTMDNQQEMNGRIIILVKSSETKRRDRCGDRRSPHQLRVSSANAEMYWVI